MFRATMCLSSGGKLYEYNFWYNHSVLVVVRYAGQDGTSFHLDLHTGGAGVGRCPVAYATWQRPTSVRPANFHVCKTRGCLCSFRLLIMGGVSSETYWASFKIRKNKNFDTMLHLVAFFTLRIVLWCMDPRTSKSWSVSTRICATQHTERETSIPQGLDARIFNDLHSQSK